MSIEASIYHPCTFSARLLPEYSQYNWTQTARQSGCCASLSGSQWADNTQVLAYGFGSGCHIYLWPGQGVPYNITVLEADSGSLDLSGKQCDDLALTYATDPPGGFAAAINIENGVIDIGLATSYGLKCSANGGADSTSSSSSSTESTSATSSASTSTVGSASLSTSTTPTTSTTGTPSASATTMTGSSPSTFDAPSLRSICGLIASAALLFAMC